MMFKGCNDDTPHNDTRREGAADGKDETAAARSRYGLDEPQLQDRAKYGDYLLNRLAKDINRKGFEPRSLRLYRRIYLVYPQLGTEIGSYLHNNSLGIPDASGNSIWQSMTAKLQTSENQPNEIWQSAITKLEEWSTPADWSRRISSSANTVSSCRLRTISSNTCWRTSRKRNSRN